MYYEKMEMQKSSASFEQLYMDLFNSDTQISILIVPGGWYRPFMFK